MALGIETSSPELFTNRIYSPNVTNARIDQNSVIKRWGYSLDRTLPGPVYDIALYQLADGSRYTLYLTDTDLCCRETAVGGTWSYKTETYTTGTISGITTTAVTGSGAAWQTAGIAAGDKFIIDSDHDADTEPDTHWATVASVGGENALVLTGNYTGAATTGTYKIRKLYSIPTNERWSWAVVGDKFCFTNGSSYMQYWDGSGYAANLNATYTEKARYCQVFANRLFIVDMTISAARHPVTIRWSKENDPTDWTDSTAGEQDFLETDDFITGLGRVGSYLVVYKRDSIILGTRSGDAEAPVSYQSPKKGIGLVAPWSLVEFMGTNAFLGRDDFYILDGDAPTSIGGPIRDKFLKEVGASEIERVFGYANYNANEIYWVANTSTGQKVYTWNYKTNQWTINTYPLTITGFGRGAI
jgi:hypothetical protein